METITGIKKQLDRIALEAKVKKMYKEVALYPDKRFHFEMGRALAERLGYPSDILDQIPQEAIESFAGVGYYFDQLNLQKGETVIDLGSGSGMDVFFASTQVGQTGKVIGIDMTTSQLEKSIRLANTYGVQKLYFQRGYIEQLPIESNTVDAVISNGVINLSAEKEKVFVEAARILKPGGRLAIADIVTSTTLDENISCNAALWAACIGGAMQVDAYTTLIEKAGLTIVSTKKNPYQFLSKSAKGAADTYGIKSISICAVK